MSFRDERYMPFEGQGAVGSQWQLGLPKTFKPFDYQTINDVILTLSYTAEEGGTLRGAVERENGPVEGAIHQYPSNNPVQRVFSLRQDFSETFHRLLHSPVDRCPVHRHRQVLPGLPRRSRPDCHRRHPRPAPGTKAALTGLSIQLNETAFDSFTTQSAFGDLPGASLGTLFSTGVLGTHKLRVAAPGKLAPHAPPPGDTSALDERKLLDIMLCIEYRLKTER
jgi:hypothetical protein